MNWRFSLPLFIFGFFRTAKGKTMLLLFWVPKDTAMQKQSPDVFFFLVGSQRFRHQEVSASSRQVAKEVDHLLTKKARTLTERLLPHCWVWGMWGQHGACGAGVFLGVHCFFT